MSILDMSVSVRMIDEAIRHQKRNAIDYIYPDSGPVRRELYHVHQACLSAGADTHCRYFLGGNRVGKSRGLGAYETACHATGEYPPWWTGFRIPAHVGAPEIWISGESNEWLRDNAWKELLGPPEDIGTGMIRGSLIAHIDRDSSPAGAIGRAWIRHKSGRKSIIGSKTWHEGRDAYSGTKRWFIWCDEEHPQDIIQECKMRTMSTVPGEPTGRILCTLTPLDGITEFIAPLVRDADTPDRRVFFCGWDDVPHLTEEAKRVMLADMPEMQRLSRTKGIPDVGEGQIYPYPESQYLCDPFDIPDHWFRAYGMDTGRKFTAACWGAWDRDDDIVYVYGEHKAANQEVAIHASAIKSRGKWIHGAADAAAINFEDGEQIIQLYRNEGLLLSLPDKAVIAGIREVANRFATGRLKIFRTCVELRKELPLYRWENGKIKKVNDHLMDSMRYLIRTGLSVSKQPPFMVKPKIERFPIVARGASSQSWMGG